MAKKLKFKKYTQLKIYLYIFVSSLIQFHKVYFENIPGALISISLFSRRLKWRDATLGLISTVSKIIGGLATGLARNSLEMYLGK